MHVRKQVLNGIAPSLPLGLVYEADAPAPTPREAATAPVGTVAEPTAPVFELATTGDNRGDSSGDGPLTMTTIATKVAMAVS